MSIDDVAQQIIDTLHGKVIIHRYNSYTTNSVYLKFDYGEVQVQHSMRAGQTRNQTERRLHNVLLSRFYGF